MVIGLPLTERNLILTGYVEPNKPRLGRDVAAQLRMPFIDLDQLIETRYGDPLERIRSTYGERRVKTIEADLMSEMLLHRQTVIRIHGSTLMHSDHLARIQETGVVICLVARLDAILQRMHLSLGARYHDPAERAMALGVLQREWGIRKLPHVHELDLTYHDEALMIRAIVELWQQLSIARA